MAPVGIKAKAKAKTTIERKTGVKRAEIVTLLRISIILPARITLHEMALVILFFHRLVLNVHLHLLLMFFLQLIIHLKGS